MIAYLFLSLFISFLLLLFIVIKAKKANILISDHLHTGPQKFHSSPTPRIGGLGIFLAMIFSLTLAFLRNDTYYLELALVVLCSIPVFLSGLIEDVYANLSAKFRFIPMSLGPVMAFFILNASIERLDLPIDYFFSSFSYISFIFTVFAIVGIINAINIIDGFNGLASMVSIIIFLALGYVSYKVSDYFLVILCLSLIGAIIGFFILNYPNGLIFLGDGGAYLIGFVIGLVSVLLVNRHPDVSPWFPLVVCIYPIFEVLFSIYRRVFIKGSSPFMPDALHLHTIIYRRITKKILGVQSNKLKRNYSTSPFLWFICTVGVMPGLLWWNNTKVLMISASLFILIYICLYWKILMWRTIKTKRVRRVS